MKFHYGLLARLAFVIFLFVEVFAEELLEEVEESVKSNKQIHFKSLGDQRARQGRPISAVVDVVPTYSVEFRSPNQRDIKFTSEGKLYRATVPEIAPLETSVKCDLKMGVYAPEESKVEFAITAGNEGGSFSVSARRLKDFIFMDIKTRKMLNREGAGSHLLTLEAQDSEKKATLDTTRVNVSVTDLNDNRPIFARRFQHVTIDEDIPLHTSIAKVVATDADIGPNGWLYFSFRYRSSFFAIDPVSGVVTVTRSLAGRKKRKSYELLVIARDRSLPPSRPASAKNHNITVTVRPVNRFPPVIKVISQLEKITEGKSGFRCATVRGSDEDYGILGEISKVRVTHGNGDGNFKLRRSDESENEFFVELVQPLDREKTPAGINLGLTAFDKGTPPRNGTVTLHFMVEDTNDMTPRFSQEKYVAKISELAPQHSSVIRVLAVDGDAGENGRVYYTLGGDDGGSFLIDQDTGLITTAVNLDHEAKRLYELEVRSLDGGDPRQMDSVKVSVEIEDANDHDPMFDESSYSIDIFEDQSPGAKLLTVTASDQDSGDNGKIQYMITNTEYVPFAIDVKTGEIRALTSLDRDLGMPEHITLQVRASDFGKPFRRESETYVHIRVKAFNDNLPVFEYHSCAMQVAQDAPVGTVLISLSAIDIDIDSQDRLVYSIEQVGNRGQTFSIDQNNGELKVSKPLREARVSSFKLYVSVTDTIQTSKFPVQLNIDVVSSAAAVGFLNYAKTECKYVPGYAKAVELIRKQGDAKPSSSLGNRAPPKPGNIYRPEFQASSKSEISVSEGVAVGSTIATFTANDKDQGYDGMVLYSIVSGNINSSFNINMYTGVLYVESPLDREKVSQYTLNISASDCGLQRKTTFTVVHISVLDINDNSPVFEKERYEVNLLENITRGQTVVLLEAIDLDEGDNGKVSYKIVNDFGGKFRIDSRTGRLSVASLLDHEERARYNIEVQAFDHSKISQKMNSVRVTVNVIDINDNAPSIIPQSFNVSVPEDIPAESVVATVPAEDLDTGLGGELEFSLLDNIKKFKIDSSSGVIRLRRPVDHESKKVYNLTVKVSDKTNQSLSSYGSVVVNILDVNENNIAPIFPGGPVLQASVLENQPAGRYVLKQKASDEDSWFISYAIIDGTGLDKFKIDSETAEITTTKVLHRKEADHYWLNVQAKDGEVNPLHTNIPLLITVLPAKDDPPYFKPPLYFPTVQENAPKRVSVVSVKAHDPGSDGSNLVYSIVSGNKDGKFAIGRKTGLVVTTMPLDREEKDHYELKVKVSNGKTPPQFAMITFPVTVTDENDNDPKFLQSMYYVTVKDQEASSTPTELFRVTALDKDFGSNSDISYGLSSVSRIDAGKLTIDPNTGIISSKEAWQAGAYMDFKVVATDSGTPPRSVSVSVSLDIEARNEPSLNAPEFQEEVFTGSIKENAEVGSEVASILAVDSDSGVLSYSIISGNTGSKFQIDRETGQVTLAGKVDREETSSYSLTIQASDDHNVGRTTLMIQVLDTNDNAPEPVMTEYQVQILENAKPGTYLTTVEAKDPDEGVDGRVSYAIVGSMIPTSLSLFKIDGSTGKIKTIKPLDYKDAKEHILIVKASDQGSPVRESLFSVVISVVDVNNHKPVFLRSEFEAEVHVDAVPSTSVLKVFASDGDDGTNAMLKFSINQSSSAFYIDQNSGIIQVATKLSRSIKKYRLKVQVSDCGTPALTAEAEVEIFVRGIKKPTVFERSLYEASIHENVGPGHAILNVVFNGSLASYELVAQESACWRDFEVSRKSGVIRNKKPFDAEELSECKLVIGASGSDGEQQTHVIVKIIDENDNAPEFSKTIYVGHVTEGLPKDSLVIGEDGKPLVIDATDADVSGSDLLFEVVGSSAFLVDPHGGALMTTQELDYESVSSYKFKIKVSDGGDPNLATFTDVEVLVRDLNDIPPKFTSPSFDAVVFLPAFPGTEVLKVSATDGDKMSPANLTYFIADASHGEAFDISASSGVITVKNSSILQEAVYQVKISVSDGNFTQEAVVEISCMPLPVSDLKFSRAMYNASVVEGLSIEAELAEVRAVGYSVGETIRYSIVTPSDLFVISESTGVLSTLPGKEIDRETVGRYDIVVQARDNRKPSPRVAQSVVSVTVDDVNDNEPKFTDESYFFVVQKSVDVEVRVGQVLAVDKDTGSNGDVRYLLVGGDEGRFRVEHHTGIVKVRSLLDGVVVPRLFNLEIEAHDLGLARQTAQIIVKIKVVDKKTPIFDQLAYSKVVKENVKVGHEICSVQARSPGGAHIVYTIVQGDPRNEFSIDFNTGLLTLDSSLDYEKQTSYQLTVQATDTKTSSAGEVNVDVTVIDVNDISPVFNQSLYLAMISEAVAVDTSVISVHAFDGDSGVNKALTYRLESLSASSSSSNKSKVNEFFFISKRTGEISVAKELDYETHVVHELKVVASDGGSPSLTGEARVRIVVEDANDNAPRFEEDSYATSISGEAGPGFFVTRVIATDPDESDAGKLRYSISSGQGKEFFQLDPRSGVLTISGRVGLERGKVYDIGVQVTDGNSIAETSVRVIIGNTNDHSPLFDQETYTINFHENYPEGTFVTMVTATDEDSGTYARLRYSIDDLEAAEKFTIDAETGMIYSRLTFDRENVSHAFTSLPVRATDGGGRFGFCTVEVRILDENDNQPTFELPRYEVTIQSSKPVGTPVLVTSATDADTGSNSALTYVIIGHQTPPVFDIEADTGTIRIAQKPEEKTYKFFVLVKDGGNPQLRNMIPVSVNVLSRSANILQFDQPEYRVSVPENSKAGSVVTTLRPSFPGSARPSVSFKIVPGNSPSSHGEKFSIDSRGQLKLSELLDYETLKRYVLIIEAEASAISQVARTVVVISVTDINDNQPHFVSNPYRVSAPENIKVGSKVLRVFAEDLDSSNNGQILYDFTGASKQDSSFFAIDQYSGWITTALPLDRELSESLVLRVRATDRGEVAQLSGYTAVHVTILDVNDSPPKFARDIFEFFVREDALIGQEVGTLEATDKDSNSDIFFFIMSGDPQAKFGIEQKTGKIFVHSSLDRELVSSYKLNVSTSDGLYTSFSTLNITVLDANDNPPVCTQSLSIVTVSEDVKPGSEVLIVEATDEDADDKGRLKYSVFGQGTSVFTVENGTGRLLTATSLDREKQDIYNFMVSAEDRGGRACFSNVTVLLDDVNDNAPVFTQAQYSVSVYEDARVNKVLLQVKADDLDIGKNRKISYSLLNTADDTFSIDSATGIITLKKGLNREQQAEYTLAVRAEDGGVPPKSGNCSVVIQVLNINDVPPEFLESRYKANVSESAVKDTLITNLQAISREASQEEFTYVILEGPDADLFAIDKKTGDVTLQGDLDYETRKSYSLTIQARDAGPPVLSATTYLRIIVTDANDNAPKFGQSAYQAKVDENSAVETFVLQVFATDLDSGSNRDIRYKIVKGNEAGRFKIDHLTGLISLAAPVDHEVESRYSLTVQARDQGKPPMFSEAPVRVLVNDVNDNPPEFSHTNFTVSIGESAPVGTEVIYLRPHDRDGPGNSGPFTFMRLEGDESKFKLQRDGLITKAGPLNHQDGEHTFKVRVFDNGEPRKFTDKTVTIKVVESVTQPPDVHPLTVSLNLYGSQFNGGVIGSVQGSDRDGDALSYAIVEPEISSPFTITASGEIRATSDVLSKMYNLNVSVTDGKYFSYAPVEIDVSDISDDILKNSLTLRLSNLGPGAFVEKNLVKCREYLGNLLNVPSRRVHIWSLQSVGSSLDVVFAVMKRSRGFFESEHIANKLNSSRGNFQRRVGVTVAYIKVSQCRLMQCPENYSCQTVFKPQNKQIRIMSERTTYISYEHSRSHACMCDQGCGSPFGKCAAHPCPVGYECSESPNGYQCTCVDSSKCDLANTGCTDTSCIEGNNAMTFTGNSYIRYRLKGSFDESSRSISLALRTTEPQGTLVFAAGQYDYSILEIVEGHLQLRFDFGSGAGVVNLDWAKVNDGKWHHVKVTRQGNHATLTLDHGIHRAWNKSPGKMRILNLDDNSIYFGAKVVGSKTRRDMSGRGQRVENGFKGCLQNLNMNNRDLPMAGSNSYVTAQPFNSSPGCNLSGACRVNTCPRASRCVETLTSHFCDCLPHHSESNDCLPFEGCEANPCLNKGTCLYDSTHLYRCECPMGYTGIQCEIFIGQCASAPCQNGGTCSAVQESDFTCDCPRGVRGRTCEQDTRPCASNPCSFGANCTNAGNDYKCECPAGLSGKTCNEGYNCERQPCQNGGTCQEKYDDEKRVCSCLPTFTGPDCSLDVDECASSPCQNAGVCENTFGGFKCNCSMSDYGGTLCEQVLARVEAQKGWPLGRTEIIGIAVVIAVLLLVVILVLFILRWRAKRKRERLAQAEAAKTSVVKVSPPVVGSEVTSPEPPTPPPREVHGYNVDDLGMPPGYDAEDSWRRRERARKDFGTMKTLNSISDNNLPGYHWDYTDIPDDLVPRTSMSKENSGSYEGAPKGASLVPEVPQRPSSFRSSQGSLDVPEVPKRPRNYRVSESEDGYGDPVPNIPKKPLQYLNPKGKSASRYSMDSRYSEFSDATDLDPDIFKGRFPRPPKEPYPESLDQHPVGSYAPTLTARGSELGSVTDGIYSEDDLEQVYLGNRMEACDDSPENSYLHSENCSEDEDDDEVVRKYAYSAAPDPEFHKALRREITEMMNELEELKLESEI